MNYYDIDDILMREGKLKVTFEYPIQFFGFYYSYQHEGIPALKPAAMPLFLIDFLLENEHCKLIKSVISETMKNELLAKASIVDVYRVEPYFFSFLKRVYLLLNQQNFLYEILTERLSDYSVLLFKNAFSEDDIAFLDVKEKKLIIKARQKYLKFNKNNL
ncbi:DNA replication complex GINS protein psf3 [Astathelohania contejeani]|uniref:DNA replication complex GINS protein PSF3 n=1 Tax=Astathelohania contejeani TaxID=164912 RepID=A0ABQ7HZ68_9MICR|nr:DNA replication complex GINS protein psf3 [Thelohania contejeani]